MAMWIYKARNAMGKELEGKLEAESKDALEAMLRRRKVTLISAKKEAMKLKLPGSGGVPSKDLARFTRQFATMSSSGLPLLQSLDILTEQADNPNLREVLQKVIAKIQGGGSLFEALSMHPKVFDELYCNMVQAGEQGGILEEILLRLADYAESYERLKRKIKKAMTYPVIVLLVAVSVVWILLAFVVPIFANMFKESGGELPAPTQIVVNMSDFLRDNGLMIFAAIVAALIAFVQYKRTEKGQYNVDKLVLSMPVIGDLARKSAVARFSQTLGTLTNSGVPIIDALRVTAKTAGNKVLERGIYKVIESLSGGQTIAEPLRETGVFQPMVIQMIGVGEKTGEISTMLLKVSEFYKEEVDAAVDNMTSMIEPLIIVFLGVVIGGILVAMYLPIFSMADTVK